MSSDNCRDISLSECVEWQGVISPNGYGRVNLRYAHRIVYEECFGEIPDGLQIDHLCRNRRCVNPYHMEAVTQRENIIRGESQAALNFRKTHCKNGHEFTADNTAVRRSNGSRVCIECRKLGLRRLYANKRAIVSGGGGCGE